MLEQAIQQRGLQDLVDGQICAVISKMTGLYLTAGGFVEAIILETSVDRLSISGEPHGH